MEFKYKSNFNIGQELYVIRMGCPKKVDNLSSLIMNIRAQAACLEKAEEDSEEKNALKRMTERFKEEIAKFEEMERLREKFKHDIDLKQEVFWSVDNCTHEINSIRLTFGEDSTPAEEVICDRIETYGGGFARPGLTDEDLNEPQRKIEVNEIFPKEEAFHTKEDAEEEINKRNKIMINRVVIKGHDNVYVTRDINKVIKIISSFWERDENKQQKIYVDRIETEVEDFVNLDEISLSLHFKDEEEIPCKVSPLFQFLEEDEEGEMDEEMLAFFSDAGESPESIMQSIEAETAKKSSEMNVDPPESLIQGKTLKAVFDEESGEERVRGWPNPNIKDWKKVAEGIRTDEDRERDKKTDAIKEAERKRELERHEKNINE